MLKYQVSREAFINIYFSFIRPVQEYGDIVGDNCTLYYSNLLESGGWKNCNWSTNKFLKNKNVRETWL